MSPNKQYNWTESLWHEQGQDKDYMMIIRIMVIRYTLHRLRMNMRKPRGDIVVAQAGDSLNCKGENLIFIQNSFTYRLINCILQGLTTLRIDWLIDFDTVNTLLQN